MRSVGRRWGSLCSYTGRNQTGCCKLAVASGLYNAGVPANRVRTGSSGEQLFPRFWLGNPGYVSREKTFCRPCAGELSGLSAGGGGGFCGPGGGTNHQVAIGSLLAGGAGSLLSLIKMMHSLGGGNLEELGIALNVACLSLGYAIFLNLLLLPVGFLLRKTLGEIEQADKVDQAAGTISVRRKRSRAG